MPSALPAPSHSRACQRLAILVLVCALVCALTLVPMLVLRAPATAAAPLSALSQTPSVLLVDASLGDLDLFRFHWLGADATTLASDAHLTLETALAPSLWQGEASTSTSASSAATSAATQPATFLLGSSAAEPITAEDIVWALDKIAKSGACPKTVIVSVGVTGLQTRRYVADLATTRQSDRADVVGLVFLGTPHGGYRVQERYPRLKLWNRLTTAAGFDRGDVVPNSALLTEIDARPIPAIIKTLNVRGVVGDIGFGSTDGALEPGDMEIPENICAQQTEVQARATISQAIDLSAQWETATKWGGQKTDAVDAKLVERLTAIDSYASSAEVKSAVREFYRQWFNAPAPITALASVLTLDTSGSMLQKLDKRDTKLAAAKTAATDFLKAVAAHKAEPLTFPEQVEVLGFNTRIESVATDANKTSISAVSDIHAAGNTDMEKGLNAALKILDSVPLCADKHILLLSDGVPTRGKTGKALLAGPVQKAADAGISIDTLAFAGAGQADVKFLKKIAQATGGNFYQSGDTKSLSDNFITIYQSFTPEQIVLTAAPQARSIAPDHSMQFLMLAGIALGFMLILTIVLSGRKTRGAGEVG
ncbi:MAG: VWA domain-containing protein [Actinomycetes bacterium]|nr:VWA domain-containing protein [Actinomycetes bacterium]